MTPDPALPDRDDVDVVLDSRRHVLFQDASGYSIWRVADDVDEPIATFEGTDDGLEDALERWDRIRLHERSGTILSVLAWVVGTLAALWLVLTAFVVASGVLFYLRRPIELDRPASLFWSVTVQEFLTVFHTALFVAVGLYVVIWMQFRRRYD